MDDAYALVKRGKLNLKGVKDNSRKKHKKHKKRKREENAANDDDSLRHGGWWAATEFEDISGTIAIEMGEMRYIEALDNGLFKIGDSHEAGSRPEAQEVLTATRFGDHQVALKSGYDKYVSVEKSGRLTARADAISSQELWQAVFQDGKTALLGSNNCFLSVSDSGEIRCSSLKVGEHEVLTIRCGKPKEKKSKHEKPKEEEGSSKTMEINYVKKFQSFQDRHLRVNSEDKSAIKAGKESGNLHEVLLDRRAKMKSDRYCK